MMAVAVFFIVKEIKKNEENQVEQSQA